ncbi:MAG: alpha/beta hydrolase family esterase [Acidimicrobiales bacterium]
MDKSPVRALGVTLAILASFGLLMAACAKTASPPSTTAGSTVPTSTSATDSGTTTGCGKSATAGTSVESFQIGGRTRTVRVHVPTGYSGSQPVALVLNLHGSASDAVEQEGFTGMDATSDSDGFIVAFPQAMIPDGAGYDWNVPGVPLVGGRAVPAGSPDDVTFLTSLVHVLEQRYCVSSERVYATGFSGGARMSSQLACDASTVFAAVAPVSGLRLPTPCPATRAVPILSFHGTADPVDPYNGHGQAYWVYSVPQAAKYWAVKDGCGASAATSTPAATVTLTKYSGCRDGAVVELYTIAGEGHEWPGGPHLGKRITRALGPQTTAVDADQLIWAFFAAHPMTGK